MALEIDRIASLNSLQGVLQSRALDADTWRTGPTSSGSISFESVLSDLNSMQKETDHAIERLIAGESVDLHQVMISVEQTDLAFRVAMQLRNKLVQAYQEVMRMQV